MVIKERYPLSTADGKAIPLDVVRPYSLLLLSLTAAAGSTAKQLPTGIDLFSVIATVDCFIKFYATANTAEALAVGVEELDTLFIHANLNIVVCPPVDKPYFSARALSTSGNLYIQFLESWTGLTLQSQINRR